MKRALALLLLCALSLSALSGCSAPADYEALTAQPIRLTDQEMMAQDTKAPHVYQALTDFGLQLLRGAREQEQTDTLISPLSAALALSMAANGAEGDTLEQFEAVLAGGEDLEALNVSCRALLSIYTSLSNGSTQASIANSLWTDPDGMISEDFIGRCIGIFDAQVFSAQLSDPGIVEALNNWVSDQTQGLIPRILDKPFSQDAAALLVNALYLKNAWETEFDPLDTGERDFTHAGGNTEQMDFLRHYERHFPYLELAGAQGALLPYDDRRLAFFALMPDAGTELGDWLDTLEGDAFSQMIRSAREEEDALFLRLSLPKFEAEWRGDLKAPLSDMGLDLAFDETGRADFSRLGENPGGYFLSQVIHAAKIEVNEKGTEAAAATVVEASGGAAAPQDGITLDFDRPFLYGIVDMQNGVPLFLGTFE